MSNTLHHYKADPWRSACCNAHVMGEVSAMGVGAKMYGRCGKCREFTDFWNVDHAEEDEIISDPTRMDHEREDGRNW